MRVVLLSAVLVVMSCGEPRAVVPNGPPLTASCVPNGTYINEAVLRSKDGVCARALAASRDALEFSEGAFVSPAAVFIPCSTAQTECTLTVTCQVLEMHMVFTGDVVDDGARIVGVATFTGKGECKSAIYDLEAVRSEATDTHGSSDP